MQHATRLLAGLLLSAVSLSCGGSGGAATFVSGHVLDGTRGVPGATVRVQATTRSATTDLRGSYVLAVGDMGPGPHRLTAWAPGYFCAGPVEARAGATAVTFQLHAHTAQDDPSYAWLPSVPDPSEGGAPGCSECHASADSEEPGLLPVDEWRQDAHAQSVVNARFLTMYLGTDVDGNRTPTTRYVQHPDYGRIPLPPDPALPYYGPGYKVDFPDRAGNCACCHAPAAAIDAPYAVDPSSLTGVAREGLPCDFCHKIWAVDVDPSSGLPFENRPGVLSFALRRPPAGEQFFAGPLDDVAPGEDTFVPLQRESAFCAPCHYGVFWGVTVYGSFAEWLASPYSDPRTGQTCQDCHMPRLGATHFARPEKGGLQRDASQVASHRMPGAADEALLRAALSLSATAWRDGPAVLVRVLVTNDKTGHKVPTDSPLRHVILHVEARTHDGRLLTQLAGPRIPAWGGLGDPAEGNYGDQPGTAYAHVLEELWTEISPSGAYWNPTRVLQDTRLAPYAVDETHYTFSGTSESVTVTVRLLFRRAFIELMRQKGWMDEDILMREVALQVP